MPYEVLTGFVTAPGAALTALTMGVADSLTVRKTTRPRLLNVWTDAQAAGVFRITSVLFHDAVQGLRYNTVASAAGYSTILPLAAWGFFQPLQSQDLLTAVLSGSAVAADIETAVMLLYYDELPGSQGRWIDEAGIRDRAVQPFNGENTLALGAAGGYSGAEAINADFDNYKAETDYALVGYQVAGNECAVVGWRGADTGNLRVGGPGNISAKQLTGWWFAHLGSHYGFPMIPVVNAANRAQTNIDGAQDENAADPVVTQLFMQLTAEAEKQAAATSSPGTRAVAPTTATAAGRLPIGIRVPAPTARRIA